MRSAFLTLFDAGLGALAGFMLGKPALASTEHSGVTTYRLDDLEYTQLEIYNGRPERTEESRARKGSG
jgi:hypothetical protein